MQNNKIVEIAVFHYTGLTLRQDICNASRATWDEISNWLIGKDLCNNKFFAHVCLELSVDFFVKFSKRGG